MHNLVLPVPVPAWPRRVADSSDSIERHGSQDSTSSNDSSSRPLYRPDYPSFCGSCSSATLQRSSSQSPSTTTLAPLLPLPVRAHDSSHASQRELRMALRKSPSAMSLQRPASKRVREKSKSRNGSFVVVVLKGGGKETRDRQHIKHAADTAAFKPSFTHHEVELSDGHTAADNLSKEEEYDIEAQQPSHKDTTRTRHKNKSNDSHVPSSSSSRRGLKARKEFWLITIPTLVRSAGTVVIAVMNVVNYRKF